MTGVRIDRDRFAAHLSQTSTLDLQGPQGQALLQDLGVSEADLGPIGDGDHIIAGTSEFAELFDRLCNLDQTKPAASGQIDRAALMYQRLVTGALVDHGTAAITSGRGAPIQAVYTERNLVVDRRAAQLQALPAPASARGKTPTPTVQSYVDAMAAREAFSRGELKLKPGKAPPGMSGEQWNLTAALEKQQITSADLRFFLATGELPDLLNADGEVVKSGADRTKELYQHAGGEGQWTAVNSVTFLHGMQEASLLAEATVFDAALAAAPADSPDRAALAEAAQANRDGAKGSAAFRQKLYRSASIARERRADGMVSTANRLNADAAKETDPKKAAELNARADALRDKGVAAGLAEGKYRAGIKGGLSASSAYQVAARGRIDAGAVLVRGLGNEVPPAGGALPQLPSAVPAPLNDQTDNPDGLPGAGAILKLSRDVHPGGAKGADGDQRQLTLEGNLSATIADYHRVGADRAGYFATERAGVPPPPRTPLGVEHRSAYLAARVEQLDTLNKRMGLYSADFNAGKLSPAEVFEASQVATGRQQILGEFEKDLGDAVASDKFAQQLGQQVLDASDGAKQSKDATASAKSNLEGAKKEADDVDPVTRADGEDDYQRDQQAVRDASTLSRIADDQVAVATGQSTVAATGIERAQTAKASADLRASRDQADARLVVSAISHGQPGSMTVDRAYPIATKAADARAQDSETWLGRAEAAPPKDPAQALAMQTQIARSRSDLAGYWTRSVDLGVRALGEPGRAGAEPKLDRAAGLLDQADRTRGTLAEKSPERLDLASRLVSERATLAEVSAEYRPSAPYGPVIGAYTDLQLELGASAAKDLEGFADLHGLANARLGQGSIAAMFRHKGRFLALEEQGRNVQGLDDRLYSNGKKLISAAETELLGAPRGPVRDQGLAYVADGHARVKVVEDALDAVAPMLRVSGQQLENGQKYTDARTRLMARAELAATNKGASIIVRAPARKIAEWIEDDTMEAAYDRKLGYHLAASQPYTARAVAGSNDLADAFVSARNKGQALEFLNSMQILSDGNARERFGNEAWGRSSAQIRQFVAPARVQDSDWSYFMGVSMRSGDGVPLAKAFKGSFVGFTAAKEMLGDPRGLAFSSDMHETMDGQAKELKQTVDDLKWRIIVNTGLEVALVAVVTGGAGAPAAAGEGANALNTARGAAQVANAARTVGTFGRAVQVARGFQAAHPIIAGVVTTTAVGAGMMAASHGVRKVMGANSAWADAFDLGTNFLPIGMGHKVAGVGRESAQALASLERGAVAVEQAGAKAGTLRAFFSLERNALALKHLAPAVALASGQAVLVTGAVTYVADKGWVSSPLGQSLLGLGLNALGTAGAGALAARSAARQAKGLTPEVLRLAGHAEDAPIAGKVRTELETFLRSTEGRVPTEAELRGLSSRLNEKLGIPGQGGTPAQAQQRQELGGLLQSIAVDRATALGLHGTNSKKPLSSDQADEAILVSTEALYQARGGEAGGASRALARADTVEALMLRLGDRAPESLRLEHQRLFGSGPSEAFLQTLPTQHPRLFESVQQLGGPDAAQVRARALGAAEADPKVRLLIEEGGPATARLVGELGGPAFQRALGQEGHFPGSWIRQLAELPPDRRAELVRAAKADPDGVGALVRPPSAQAELSLRILREDGVDAAIVYGRAEQALPEGMAAIRQRGGDAELRSLLRQGPDALLRAATEAQAARGRPDLPNALLAGRGELARRAEVDPAIFQHPEQNPAAAKKLVDQMRSELPADVRARLDQEILGRRFVDQEDYNAAVAAGAAEPELTYGRADFEGWKKAASLIDRAAHEGRPLTIELLKQAHALAAEPLPNVRPQDRGRIRTEADEVPFQGGRGPIGLQSVDAEVLGALQANPNLAVAEMGPGETPGSTTVHVSYRKENVQERTQAVLDRMERRLQAGEDPVQVAADAQRDLVSIHPFIDANGRTSRLVMDYALQRAGLDPSIVRDPNIDTHTSASGWQAEVRQGTSRIFRATQEAWARSRLGAEPAGAFRDRGAVLEDGFVQRFQAGDGARSPAVGRELYALAGGPQLDPVTGFGSVQDLAPTLQGAIDQARGGKDAVVVRASLRNLGGLNESKGHSGADEHFAQIARGLREELNIPGAKVDAYRDGASLTFVITGAEIPPDVLGRALSRAEQRASRYLKGQGLDRIPHPKFRDDPAWRGVGLSLVSERVRPGDSLEAINQALTSRTGLYDAALGQTRRPPPRASAPVQSQPASLPGPGPEPRAPARAQGQPSFLSPAGARWEAFWGRAQELQMSRPEAETLFRSVEARTLDEVTGFSKAPDRAPTLARAIDHARATGDRAIYVEIDVRNLGGLNNAVGRQAADADFAASAQLIKEELSAIGADASFFRHGGDEMSAVLVGPGLKKSAVEAAMARAQTRFDQYIAARGLSELPHTKEGKAPGVGITFGVAQAKPREAPEAVFQRADLAVEAMKKR